MENGLWIWWAEDGKKTEEGNYKTGQKHEFGLVIIAEDERLKRVSGKMVSFMENLLSGIKMEINLY